MYAVKLGELVSKMNLTVLSEGIEFADVEIAQSDINRPALQLAGFYDYFDSDRVQIIGKVEYTYLTNLDKSVQREILDRFFGSKIPCLVISRNLDITEEMLEMSAKHNVPMFGTSHSTSYFMSEIIRWLKVQLAPRISIHGVLVDVFGEGVLITGESGIGKSETALELIKRGHRLVADDVVEIKKVSDETLLGSAPEIIRHFIELRGIGIIDVKTLFGVESVKEKQNINLVIKLEEWDSKREYDRMGLQDEYMELLGNKVVCHAIPIRPGRNLAIIVESAAINFRQKQMGYNAAKEFNDRVMERLNRNINLNKQQELNDENKNTAE